MTLSTSVTTCNVPSLFNYKPSLSTDSDRRPFVNSDSTVVRRSPSGSPLVGEEDVFSLIVPTVFTRCSHVLYGSSYSNSGPWYLFLLLCFLHLRPNPDDGGSDVPFSCVTF